MKNLKEKLKKLRRILKENGIEGVKTKLQSKSRRKNEQKLYEKWIHRHGILTDEKINLIEKETAEFQYKPLISIVLPVYNVEEKWLRKCLDSVINQLYENWELCIADDFSPAKHIRKVLEEFSAKDSRIKIVFRTENGHISEASNSALELATGEFCALLDHDDELSKDALFYVIKELNAFPEADFIYTDEDMIDEIGKRYEPKFKPDFSRELFYSVNYLTHLAIYRTEILRKIGGWRKGFEGSQDYDLALRVIEEIPEKNIRHISRILYHWRAIQGSVALSAGEKPYAHERARKAISEHLERSGKRAKVVETFRNFHRVRYELPKDLPKVSLIFYSENDFDSVQEKIESFLSATDYENIETIFTENADAEKLNSAVSKATGEAVCFVDLNLKPVKNDWLKELLSFAIQNEIGAVGTRILNRNEKILQHGFIVGTEEIISSAFKDFSKDESDTLARTNLVGNFSAVSIACFCVKKSLFENVGGFDFQHFPKRFFDADFCLKLGEKGLRIVFTPYAEMMKIDNKKRLNFEIEATAEEKSYFVEKWRKVFENDPFHNPNLSKNDGSFSINNK
ncbi:MAG TPA: glycosyltransferase [Pyrinomonadaceae bacterium]|nr:glycosyltransferase [Pyrinomonadaceae bacterium]